MINKTFFFLFGFGLMIIGFTYIILYANLLTMGYSFFTYLLFISKRLECLYVIIGFIIINLSIKKGEKDDDIHL
ncbi:MAG: hypothetical protein RR359_04995 [Bacilli bacterium]